MYKLEPSMLKFGTEGSFARQYSQSHIINLIYATAGSKTIQYLAGHENSKVSMDICEKSEKPPKDIPWEVFVLRLR